MKTLNHIILIILTLSVFSCDDKPKEKCGITISETNFEFDSNYNSTSIVFDDDFWWLDAREGIMVNGEFCSATEECLTVYFEEGDNPHVIKIEGEWFNIHKTDAYHLIIHISENEKEKERSLSFPVQSGNCHFMVNVSQSGFTNAE